jgi:hypothetical protein
LLNSSAAVGLALLNYDATERLLRIICLPSARHHGQLADRRPQHVEKLGNVQEEVLVIQNEYLQTVGGPNFAACRPRADDPAQDLASTWSTAC